MFFSQMCNNDSKPMFNSSKTMFQQLNLRLTNKCPLSGYKVRFVGVKLRFDGGKLWFVELGLSIYWSLGLPKTHKFQHIPIGGY